MTLSGKVLWERTKNVADKLNYVMGEYPKFYGIVQF